MNAIQLSAQPSIDSATQSRAALWLAEAMDLVNRVDASLRSKPKVIARPVAPVMRPGRRVLSNNACLSLAGFADLDYAI
jgi:hypothetical protein